MKASIRWLSAAAVSISAVATCAAPPTSGFRAGQKAPPFTAADVKGKKVALSDYRGKVVLLDFWATWCIQCQEDLPSVKKAYQQYHGKGFDILGVSWDDAALNAGFTAPGQKKPKAMAARDYLLRFTKNNGMPWREVHEPKQWQGSVSKRYGVKALPATYLIDGTTGKILAKDVRGANLASAVAKALARRGKA